MNQSQQLKAAYKRGILNNQFIQGGCMGSACTCSGGSPGTGGGLSTGGSGGIGGKLNKKNGWVNFVKKVANSNNMTYKDAMIYIKQNNLY